MTEPIAGIILAGGRSRRFGAPKPLVEWEGRPLIRHVVDAVRPTVSSLRVMVKDPGPYEFLEPGGVLVSRDMTPDPHPLGGLYSGLSEMEEEAAFVCGADMPEIRTRLIPALAEARGDRDAVVPIWDGRLQPLCAIYSRSCLSEIGRMLDRGELRILDLFDRVRTRVFSTRSVRVIDPTGRSFVDVDTREALRALSRLEPEETPHHAD